MNVMLRHMFFRILGTTAGLSAVMALSALIIATPRLMNLLAHGVISLRWFGLTMAILLPSRFDNVILFAVAISIVYVYARSGLSNEIIPLRMAGLSDRALAMPGLGAAAVGMMLTAFLSLYLVPISLRLFADIVHEADFNLSLALLDEGYPQQIAPNLSISFRKRAAADVLEDVTILDGRKTGRFTYILAHQAHLIRRPGAGQERVLILETGSYQERSESEENPTPVAFDELSLPISLARDGSSRVRTWHGSFEQSIWQLFHPPPEVKADPTVYGIWLMDANQRIALPLECLGYALLSLGGLLTVSHYRRSATALHVGAVVAIIAAYRGILLSTHPLFVKMPALMPAYYVLAVIPGTAGALLLMSKEFGSRLRVGKNPRRSSAAGVGVADAEASTT